MKYKNHIFIIVIIIIFIAISVVYYFINNNNKQKNDNLYYINDQTLGISFYITKDFERIDQKSLTFQNPYIVYGFKPSDVSEVSCYITQTKRSSDGLISREYLKEGTFEKIKTSYSDAELEKYEDISFGNYEAVKLYITYLENEINTNLVEAVGTTDKLTTFAFCSCPHSLYEFYKPVFDQFLDSIEIY